MKAVILAGGLGTRISEETSSKPKPMVEVGGYPLLWHIMKIYSFHGINDFIICAGYKNQVIKEYFCNYFLHASDLTLDLRSNSRLIHNYQVEPWKITIVDTGNETMTGGRLKRVKQHIGNETFLLTYGDGVANIDIKSTIGFHKEHKKLCTITAVQPPGRFGALDISEENTVKSFMEKPRGDSSWINGGFFVVEPEVLNRIEDDTTIWEQEPLKSLARDGELKAYYHDDFWQPVDTLREKNVLESLWASGEAKWKVWD